MQFPRNSHGGAENAQSRGRSFLFSGRRGRGQRSFSGQTRRWSHHPTPSQVHNTQEDEEEQKSIIVQLAKNLPDGAFLYLHLTQIMRIHKDLGIPEPRSTASVFGDRDRMDTDSTTPRTPDCSLDEDDDDHDREGHGKPDTQEPESCHLSVTSLVLTQQECDPCTGGLGSNRNREGQAHGESAAYGTMSCGSTSGEQELDRGVEVTADNVEQEVAAPGGHIGILVPSSLPLPTRHSHLSYQRSSTQQVYYNQANVKQIDVPSFSGAFGILPSHVPTLAVLKPGVVTVYEQDGSSKKFFVSSGSVTVNDDSSVQVLAEEAVPLDMLDASAAREALTQAQSSLARAAGDKEKAEAQIAVEVAEALVDASK